MYKVFFTVVALIIATLSFAQSLRVVPEDSSIIIDGVKVAYTIIEEQTKSSGGEEFARFKIRCVVTNIDCHRFFRYRLRGGGQETGNQNQPNKVATFFIRNANGKRFTSREVNLQAGEWWVPVQVKEKNNEGKEVTNIREMMAGYIFKTGESIDNTAIVLVPLGKRPQVEVMVTRNLGL